MTIFKTSDTELVKYNGKACEVIEPLIPKDYDKDEVGLMFTIRLENGIEIQAFEDEIMKVDN